MRFCSRLQPVLGKRESRKMTMARVMKPSCNQASLDFNRYALFQLEMSDDDHLYNFRLSSARFTSIFPLTYKIHVTYTPAINKEIHIKINHAVNCLA